MLVICIYYMIWIPDLRLTIKNIYKNCSYTSTKYYMYISIHQTEVASWYHKLNSTDSKKYLFYFHFNKKDVSQKLNLGIVNLKILIPKKYQLHLYGITIKNQDLHMYFQIIQVVMLLVLMVITKSSHISIVICLQNEFHNFHWALRFATM